jgi:hypothetical protein
MQNPAQHKKVFTRTQIVFLCFGLLSQLTFFPTIQYYLERGVWGYPRLSWVIANQSIPVLWFEISSNALLSTHVVSSYALYAALLLQLGLMLWGKRSAQTIKFHRTLGTSIICVLLPVFVFCALMLDVHLIKNPVNQILFAVIPAMITFGLLKALHTIRAGNKTGHVDAIFLVLICINAASITRLVMGMLYLAGIPVTFLFYNHEPTILAAIIRTFLVILMLMISYYTCGRFKQNMFPMLMLSIVLGLAIWIA